MFALVLLVVAAVEKVSGDCDEICFKLRTGSSSYLTNSCNCPLQDDVNIQYHPPRPGRTLSDLSIFYEPVGNSPFLTKPHFKTPFLIHNPTSDKNTINFDRIDVNAKIKHSNVATRNTLSTTHNKQIKQSVCEDCDENYEDLSEIYDNPETTTKPKRQENFQREQGQIFIDIEVKKSGLTNIINNYPYYEKLHFTEKDIEECIDLHIIVYLRHNNNNDELNSMWKTKYMKKYMHYNGTELDDVIDKKCKELSSIVERSLKEIEHSWPKKQPTTNNNVDAVAKISENLPNQYKQTVLEEDSKYESFEASSHNSIENKTNSRLSTQNSQTLFLGQIPLKDSNYIVNQNAVPTFCHSINNVTKKDFDASLEQETQRQEKVVTPNFTIDTLEKSLECDTNAKKFERFPLTSENTPTASEFPEPSTHQPINDYLDSTTYVVNHINKVNKDDLNATSHNLVEVKQGLSHESTTIASISADNSFDVNTEATITHENIWSLPSIIIEPKSTLRNEYNQSEISIQRIITKELTNNTVTSDTYGYETYTEDEIEIDELTTMNPPMETKIGITVRNDEDLISANSLYYTSTDFPTNYNTTVQNVTQEITGKLYFVFNNFSVPVKFIQERDARLRLGLDAMALCDILTKDKPSILISALCNLPKNT